MPIYVTVTSQGQISIPAKIRQYLNLEKNNKLVLNFDNKSKQITLKPSKNFMMTKGILKKKALKSTPLDKTIELEHKALETEIIKSNK